MRSKIGETKQGKFILLTSSFFFPSSPLMKGNHAFTSCFFLLLLPSIVKLIERESKNMKVWDQDMRSRNELKK